MANAQPMAAPSFASLLNFQRAKARAAVVDQMTGRVSVTDYQMEAKALRQLCFISIKVGADGQEVMHTSLLSNHDSQNEWASMRER